MISYAEVKVLLKENQVKKSITEDHTKNMITCFGYNIIRYSRVKNDERTLGLIDSIGVNEYIEESDKFVYNDGKRKLIFIEAKIRNDDLIPILLHEVGHIVCQHLQDDGVFISTEQQEDEVRQFLGMVDCCLENNNRKAKLLPYIATFLIMITIFGTYIAYSTAQYNQGIVHITPTGQKYHTEECSSTKKSKTAKIQRSEAEKIYDACGLCNP